MSFGGYHTPHDHATSQDPENPAFSSSSHNVTYILSPRVMKSIEASVYHILIIQQSGSYWKG